jgi:hypothetical protein
MEPFVFAGNRRRWKYLRPLVGTAAVGMGVWLTALCWVLMEAPALPSLGLGSARPTVLAQAGTPLAPSLNLPSRWAGR